MTVRVAPGPRSILQDVVVEGGDETKPSIARSIKMTPGAPLDPAGIRETRQRLYDLDVYRSVDIQVQPLTSSALPGATSPPVEQPVMARITLEERPRYRVRYGLAVSDEDVVVGVTTVGAPIFDHRGAVRAALAFNLLPGAFHRDRDTYLELARNASAEASRAFGYHLAEKGLPVPS